MYAKETQYCDINTKRYVALAADECSVSCRMNVYINPLIGYLFVVDFVKTWYKMSKNNIVHSNINILNIDNMHLANQDKEY